MGSNANRSPKDALLDKTPFLVLLKDEYGTFVYANKQVQSFGLSPDQVIGMTDYHLMTDAEATRIRDRDKEVIFEGVSMSTVECITRPDGSQMCWLVRKRPLEFRGQRFVSVLAVPIADGVTPSEVETAEQVFEAHGKPAAQRLESIAANIAERSS